MQSALAVMGICVMVAAVLSGLVAFVDERIRRRRIEADVDRAGVEHDWQEAARRALFGD